MVNIPKLTFKLVFIFGLLPTLLLSQPKLQIVGGNAFDFGDVYTFASAKKILTIKNSGNEPLVITQIDPGCGCTATLLSNDHIPPNDSGTLSITFDTRQQQGKINKVVSMITNDTSNHTIDIHFTAMVWRILEIEPEYIFIRGLTDSTSTQDVTIRNAGSDTIRILGLSPTSNLVEAKLSKEVLHPTEELTLSTLFTPRTAGMFNSDIEVRTDHPKLPTMKIRVVGWVKANN